MSLAAQKPVDLPLGRVLGPEAGRVDGCGLRLWLGLLQNDILTLALDLTKWLLLHFLN